MKSIKLIVLISFLLNEIGFSQEINFYDELKNSIIYVYAKNLKGQYIPWGTAFIISYKKPDLKDVNFKYVITAKHVVLDNDSLQNDSIFFRLNKIGESYEIVGIKKNISNKNQNIFFHLDESVDLAVIPVTIGNDVKYESIPIDAFYFKSQLSSDGISVGTETFFSGLYSHYHGYKKNNPIVRFGKISLIPDEKILFNNVFTDVILCETTGFPGNSGSPMMIKYKKGNIEHMRLIGVVSYKYNETNKIGDKKSIMIENSGITAIVPSEYIMQILELPKLQMDRKEAFNIYKKNKE